MVCRVSACSSKHSYKLSHKTEQTLKQSPLLKEKALAEMLTSHTSKVCLGAAGILGSGSS